MLQLFSQGNRPRGRGTEKAHWCKLKLKSFDCMSFALTPSPSPILGEEIKFSSSPSPKMGEGVRG